MIEEVRMEEKKIFNGFELRTRKVVDIRCTCGERAEALILVEGSQKKLYISCEACGKKNETIELFGVKVGDIR